jgi:hypothetical protein
MNLWKFNSEFDFGKRKMMYSIGPLSGPWPCGIGLAQWHKWPGWPMPRARHGRGHRGRGGGRSSSLRVALWRLGDGVGQG